MATPPSFQKAEDQYFLLKGKLQAGRITRAQFDAALKELMVQDAQGRYWTIGADNGKWFVHDGRAWVEAPLPSAAMPPPPPPPSVSPSPSFSQPAARPPKRSSTGILLALGALVVLCLLGALAGLVVVGGGLLRLGMSAPTNTPFIVFAAATPIPPAIPPAVPTAVVVVVTATPPAIPGTATPQSTKASPTIQPTVTHTLPPATTPTPLPTPTAPSIGLTATSAPPAPTATPIVPTAAPPAPTVPAAPPGLYVTGIQLDPPEPKDRQTPTFHVTFLNTLGQTVYYRWFVKIYEPEKRQSFGETAKLDSTLPDGTTTIASIANWRGVGGDPCRPFIARVFYEAPDKTILEFPKPGGDSFQHYFVVCPAN